MILGVFLTILCADFDRWADVREFGIDFGSNVGSRGSVSGLKQRLVSVKFILAGFGPERSHGDLFRDQNSGFGIDW